MSLPEEIKMQKPKKRRRSFVSTSSRSFVHSGNESMGGRVLVAVPSVCLSICKMPQNAVSSLSCTVAQILIPHLGSTGPLFILNTFLFLKMSQNAVFSHLGSLLCNCLRRCILSHFYWQMWVLPHKSFWWQRGHLDTLEVDTLELVRLSNDFKEGVGEPDYT